MKQFYKSIGTLLVFITASTLWISTSAVEINGIFYYLSGNTATVTNKLQSSYGNSNNYYTNAYSGTITIPNTITYENKTYTVTRIQEFAFYDCPELKSITIPSTITSIGNSFALCPSLKAIIVNTDNPNYSTMGGVLFNKNKTTLIYCPEAKADDYTIPSTVKKIADSAFKDCKRLTSVTIPDCVTSIGDQAFYLCTALNSVNIPTSLTFLGNQAFYGDYSLSSTINIPSGVKKIPYCCFDGCTNLNTVLFSEGLEIIDICAFRICGSLHNITFPSTLKKFGQWCFGQCSSIESITIPNGITELPYGSFYRCNLTSIELPETLQKIGDNALCGNNLSIINIPKSVTYIDAGGLHQEYTKCNVYVHNSPSQIAISNNNPFNKKGLKIHVYAPFVEAFKTTPYWNVYADYIIGDISVEPVTSITFEKNSINISPNSEGKLTAIVKPDEASIKDVTYTSSNENVVIILDNNGRFMALEPGTATITATTTDGSGVKNTCNIIVSDGATSIEENIVDAQKVVSIYDTNGKQIKGLKNGLNIVKYIDGSTRKITK